MYITDVEQDSIGSEVGFCLYLFRCKGRDEVDKLLFSEGILHARDTMCKG